MKKKAKGNYDPDTELAKGAKLEASSFDKTQQIKVTAGKVTVGGVAGSVEISGIATGRNDASINGCLGIWLSIFRFMRPDGTINHVAGWNIMLPLKAGQKPLASAKALTEIINAGPRPYKATARSAKAAAVVNIVYTEK